MNFVSRFIRAAAAAAVLVLAACAPSVRATATEQVHAMRGRDLHVVLHSGREVLLRSAYVEGDSVFGGWTSGPAGDVRVAVALADVARVQAGARLHSQQPSGNTVRGWLIVGTVAVLLIVGGIVSLVSLS